MSQSLTATSPVLTLSDILSIIDAPDAPTAESLDHRIAATWPVWHHMHGLVSAGPDELERLMAAILRQQGILRAAQAEVLTGPASGERAARFDQLLIAVQSRVRVLHDFAIAAADAAAGIEPFAVREDLTEARLGHERSLHRATLTPEERVQRLELDLTVATLDLQRAREVEGRLRRMLSPSLDSDTPDGAVAIRLAQARQRVALARRVAEAREKDLAHARKEAARPMQMSLQDIVLPASRTAAITR